MVLCRKIYLSYGHCGDIPSSVRHNLTFRHNQAVPQHVLSLNPMKNFFYLQRNDRHVIIILLVTLSVAVGFIIFVGNRAVSTPFVVTDTATIRKGNAVRPCEGGVTQVYYDTEGHRTELFPFDPNTADSTQLLRLGLKEWQVRNIYKYRARGGVYRRPSDFARLYGLTAGQYKALEPYIRISDDYRPASELIAVTASDLHVRDTVKYPLKLKPGEHVALNTADTTMLKRVPGIGSSFAQAIVDYRERLGGYYSVDQLKEINGFPQGALPYFVIGHEPEHRIDINNMTLNQLRRHPYIGFYQAKTIVDHRRLHGRIQSFDDLRLYRDFPPETIERLRHYVRF